MFQHIAWFWRGVLKWWYTPLVVRVNNDALVNNGQGDGETKWNGWAWKLLLVKFVILLFFCFKNKLYKFLIGKGNLIN